MFKYLKTAGHQKRLAGVTPRCRCEVIRGETRVGQRPPNVRFSGLGTVFPAPGRRGRCGNRKFQGLFPDPTPRELRNPRPRPKWGRGTRPAALGTGEGPRLAKGLETKRPLPGWGGRTPGRAAQPDPEKPRVTLRCPHRGCGEKGAAAVLRGLPQGDYPRE